MADMSQGQSGQEDRGIVPQRLGGGIHLVVKPGVTAKSVHAALDEIFKLSGCVACGFQGIDDLSIRVVNPEAQRTLGHIEGIQSVSITQRGIQGG